MSVVELFGVPARGLTEGRCSVLHSHCFGMPVSSCGCSLLQSLLFGSPSLALSLARYYIMDIFVVELVADLVAEAGTQMFHVCFLRQVPCVDTSVPGTFNVYDNLTNHLDRCIPLWTFTTKVCGPDLEVVFESATVTSNRVRSKFVFQAPVSSPQAHLLAVP